MKRFIKKSLVLLMVLTLSASICLPIFAEPVIPPVISVTGNPTAWTKGPITLNYNVTSLSELESIKINNSEVNIGENDIKEYNGSIIVSKNETITIEAVDKLEGKTTETVNVIYIDTEAPTLKITKIASNVGAYNSAILAFHAKDNAGLSKITVNGKVIADITTGAKEQSCIYDTISNGNYYGGFSNNYMDIVVTDIVGNEYKTYAMIVGGELMSPDLQPDLYPGSPAYPGFPTYPDLSNPLYMYFYATFSSGDKPEIVSLTEKEAELKAPEVKNGYSLKYQWQKKSGNTYVNITGANEAAYKTTPVEGDTYRVSITDLLTYRQLVSSAVVIPEVPEEPKTPEETEKPEKQPIKEEDITISGIPSGGQLTEDGMMILVPSPINGTWIFDENYFSGSNSGISVFKALKAGVTSISYVATDENGNMATKYFIIEILSNDVKAPHTCDD